MSDPAVIDWTAALDGARATVRALRPAPTPTPEPCLCGSTDIRGRIIHAPVDLTAEDVTVTRNEGQQQCRACAHGIGHGAMCVTTHMTNTSVVRDRYHMTCVRL